MRFFKTKTKKIFFLVIAVTLITSLSVGIRLFVKTNNTTNTKELYRSVNDANQEHQILRVFLIEQNPILYSITDTDLYPDNNGHPKISEFFNQDVEAAINELIDDFEFSSHGYIDVQIVQREFLDEYPQYTDTLAETLSGPANKFDEETYLDMSRVEGTNTGDWYKLQADERVKALYLNDTRYKFDYDYIISKYNLVTRKNNNEFDQVWMIGIDPYRTYETKMVGRNPYYINGEVSYKNCDNFEIATFAISRRDANLHGYNHGIENILKNVFGQSYNPYQKDSINITSQSQYYALNLYERYILNDYANSGTFNGVGTVHHPFNAEEDYDNDNENYVSSNWRDWANYPNMGFSFSNENRTSWWANPYYTSSYPSFERAYQRFWLYNMPHLTGRYSDGHLNNWWKYIYSLDYITNITENGSTNKTVNAGEDIEVDLDLEYYSGDIENLTTIPEGDNIHIQDPNVVSFRDGVLYAKNQGVSNVEVFFDGKSTNYEIRVNGTYKTFTATFDQNTASAIGSDSLSCHTYGTTCNITLPTITAEDNEEVVGWSRYSDGSGDIYNPGDELELDDDTILYAITNPTNRVTSVSLNKEEETIFVDENFTLQETVLPETAENKNVTWSSSNPEIATVENGKVTGISEGTAVITVTTEDGEKTANCIVTVEAKEQDEEVLINEINLSPERAELKVGDTLEIEANIVPDNATNKSLTWESSHMDIATVLNGVVTAVGAGDATIYAYSPDRNVVGSMRVSVEEVESESQSESQSQSQSESQSQNQSQSQSQSESQSQSQSQSESKTQSESKSQSESKTQSESKASVESKESRKIESGDDDVCMPYITYSNTEKTSDPVIAVLNVKNKSCTVTTNTYEFKENGEQELKYVDINGEEKSVIAKVDWIGHDKNDTVKNPPTGIKEVALIAIPTLIIAAGGYVYIRKKDILFRRL